MDDLIEALIIFRRYKNPKFPTHCEHDELFVAIDPNEVTELDKKRLEELHFTPSSYGGFVSTWFGSC